MIEMSKFYIMHRFLKTKSITNNFMEDLAEAESNLFKQGSHEETFRKKFEGKYGKLFEDISIDLDKKESLPKYFNEIKSYFASLDFMHITLAFPPSDEFFDKLQAVLTTIIGLPPVFDVSVDPATSGGAIIDYNGKHLDLSFNKLLKLYFEEHKDVVLSGI